MPWELISIGGAIVLAWWSGFAASESGNRIAVNLAVLFLVLAVACGWCSYRM